LRATPGAAQQLPGDVFPFLHQETLMIPRLTAVLAALALGAAAPAALGQSAPADKRASSQPSSAKPCGEKMVEDHGKMLEEQKKMAQSKGMQVPRQPNKEQQAAAKKLKEAKGEQFDRAFMSQMVKDHEKALKLAQDAAKNAKDPELKAMAQKAAPDIQQHLQMAKQLSDKASAGGSATRSKQSK
jgi:putative membrane protein